MQEVASDAVTEPQFTRREGVDAGGAKHAGQRRLAGFRGSGRCFPPAQVVGSPWLTGLAVLSPSTGACGGTDAEGIPVKLRGSAGSSRSA